MIRKIAAFVMAALVAAAFPALAADPPAPTLATLKASCDRGDAKACSNLGDRYDEGSSVAKNLATALTLWTRACTLGRSIDCAVAGRRTSDGIGTVKDPKRAAVLWQRGCELNEAYACEPLGEAYQDGRGVLRNPALALELAEKACRLGSVLCSIVESVVPEMLAKGIRPGEPMPDARNNKARCDSGHATSCLWLALRYQGGIGIAADSDLELDYLEKACQLGEGEACRRQSNHFARMGAQQAQWRPGKPYDKRFEEVAAKGYEIGCGDNDAISCSILGDMTRRGIGVPRDIVKADMYREFGCVLESIVCPNDMIKAAKARIAKVAPPAKAKPAQNGSPMAVQQSAVVSGGGIAKSGVNFGASIAEVRQSLAGRDVVLMQGTHNGGWYRQVAGGAFSDIDRRLLRLAYEFDAPEGPAAKLIGVVLTYARDGTAQSAVYRERASTLTQRYPLAPRSPAKLEATVSGTVISLIDDPASGYVYEIYRKVGAFPAPAGQSAAVPQIRGNCQAVKVKASAVAKGATEATFTASPANDGPLYSWTVSAGMIQHGQGTPSIIVLVPNLAAEPVTASVERRDPTCPTSSNQASATAAMR
jgi:TPR repeat protein